MGKQDARCNPLGC